MTAHLCSQNAHKLQEFRALVPDWELTLLDAATFPAEDGATYHDNARSKALFGREGFGFDPVFVPDGETRTVAELGNDWKSRNSHRARAAQALLAAIG